MGQGVAWLGPFSLIRIIRELPCLNPDLEDFEEIRRIIMRGHGRSSVIISYTGGGRVRRRNPSGV
jgi:hypothetical protein